MNPEQNNLIGPQLPPVAAQQATQPTTQPVVPVAKPDISGLISQTPDNSVITSADLKPVQQTQLPQPNQAVTSTTAPNYTQQLINTLEAPKTEAQGVQGNAINQILSNLGGLQGESTFRNEALEQQNYAQKLQEYQNINTQVLAKQAEVGKSDIELVRDLRNEERRDTLLPFAQLGQARITGDATIKRALLNAEIGVLNASAIAKQGDINLAINLANQAVETKYAPYRENIAMWESVLETIKPTLDADQQKQAAVQQIKADAAMREIEKEEQREKAVQEIITRAIPNAPAGVVAQANAIAQQGGSSLDVSLALGKYGGDYLGDAVKRANIAQSQASTRKSNAEIDRIRKEVASSEAPINPAMFSNTPTGFASKLLSTSGKEGNLTVTERGQLSKMSSVISQLGSLEANLANKNKTGFIKGRVNKLLGDLNLDADITTINAQIQALIPNVARGIYGEVGVLTDADIENYKKTVANLTFSGDQNDAVLALTLKNALRSYEGVLNTASNSNIDVSGWTQDYVNIQKRVFEIEDRIGVSKSAVDGLIADNAELLPAIKELYEQGFTDGEILQALGAR